MEKNLFSNYADFIRDADTAMIEREMARPSRLRLDAEIIGRREVTVAYAPFDHVVPTVRVVIIGITPGRQQARNALLEARRPLRSGATPAEQVLSGLPHPSGANAERIAFFLGRKARGDLSVKVAPDRLIAARNALVEKMSKLGA